MEILALLFILCLALQENEKISESLIQEQEKNLQLSAKQVNFDDDDNLFGYYPKVDDKSDDLY